MSRTSTSAVDPGAAGPAGDTPDRPGGRVRRQVAVGLVALVALLVVLSASVGLGRLAWATAMVCAGMLAVAVTRRAGREGRDRLGPADVVTLTRALLACAAAGLTVELVLGRPVTGALLVVIGPALAMDAVDGRIARRTGTASAFGGRFDGEADAFLILVLSVAASPTVGWWAVGAGAARYVFGAAGRVLPWLRPEHLEFRYWRKVVTAAAGLLLTVAVADALPPAVSRAAVVVVLLLLAESFGRDVWWLWGRRAGTAPASRPTTVSTIVLREAARRVLVVSAGLLAVALTCFALLAPARPDLLSPTAFLRLPVEIVLLAAALVILPTRGARVLAALAAVALFGVAVLKAADLAMFSVLDRRADLVADRGQLVAGLAFVRDSFGWWAAAGGVVAGALVGIGALTCLVWASSRAARAAGRRPGCTRRAVGVAAAAWLLGAVVGLQSAGGSSVAAHEVGPYVVDTVRATASGHRARQAFDRQIAVDPLADPSTRDLAALEGKDVLLVFVESYGRVAVEGREAQGVTRLLEAGTARLQSLGWSARSAYLTSPTFGSNSWLAHSTLQSGAWVGDQLRYDHLLTSRRMTLSSSFADAGWRTVAVLPSTRGRWPEGAAFYRFDEVYGRHDLGYAGPRFGFSAIPDQYALAALHRTELAAPQRAPVMATVALTSSHGPWAPLPTMVSPGALGDGSVFRGIEAAAVSAEELWSDRSAIPAAYRASIVYSLTSLLSFVEQHADDDLVLLVMGDHQPSTVVSGFGSSRDVPVSVIARDPGITDRVAGWGWQAGLRPSSTAPVWRMDAFRDRFLTTFSTPPPSLPGGGRP